MPTKEQFEAYEKVRTSGQFNMIMEWIDAADCAGLTKDEYFNVIKNYNWCITNYKKGNN